MPSRTQSEYSTPPEHLGLSEDLGQSEHIGRREHLALSEHHVQQTKHKHRESTGHATAVLSVLLTITLIACGYLIYLAYQWSEFGNTTHQANYDLGNSLSESEIALASARESLENTRKQLTTAQQRISELAKEKALVGDDREEQRLLAEDITEVATEALAVSRDLGHCLELQSTYMGHLIDAGDARAEITRERLKDDDDRDQDVIGKANAALRVAQDGMKEIETDLNTSCDAAVERHNELIDDLRE